MEYPEIMTIEEVAAYLRVSERTVYEWAQKEEIPAGKLGSSWRFKRSEIQSWVDKKLNLRKRFTAIPISMEDLLSPDRVVIMEATRKAEALSILAALLARAPGVGDKEELAKEIFRREELMSTGIGFGIAVPHVRLTSIADIVMAMGVSHAGITDYVSLDGKPVHIVCMIAAGKYQHTQYIKALAAISSRLKEESFRSRILTAPDPDTIYRNMIQAGR